MTRLRFEPYPQQVARWPQSGRHILAQFDDEAIVVYQAYREGIARHALEHGRFGGEFSFDRMSWIKTSFLWMMYRSGWASKPGQEVVLAVWLSRPAFDSILKEGVESTALVPDVRIQWDPDHDPSGARIARRAIQLGLRGTVLRHYASEWIVSIEDVTDFAQKQRVLSESGDYSQLKTPREVVYPVGDPAVAAKLGLSTPA